MGSEETTVKFGTKLIHYDACPGDPFRPLTTPIYQSATFEQGVSDQNSQLDDSRSSNPTRDVLERQLAKLELAERAYCFNSGLAAMSAVTRLLQAGEGILAGNDLYGGTFRLFSKILNRAGIEARYADPSATDAFASAITPNTRLIHIESPTNPLLRVADIRALASLAHEHGALLSVDSSAMSPYLQNPLELGADIVIHSATKFLSGHSDVTGGVVAVRRPELAEQIGLVQSSEGTALSPFECFLLLRGLKTLKLRLDCQQSSAFRIARHLSKHPVVRRVHFAGLSTHPGYHLHATQAQGPGALISFETESYEVSKRIVEATKLFRITVSFGSVQSSISLPSRMSHASVPQEVRQQSRLPQDLIRLSVGIEDVDDLIEDLDQACGSAEVMETLAETSTQGSSKE